MNENQKSLRTIFNEAAEIGDAAERSAYLQRACAGDESLRRKLDDLLSAHRDAGAFLNTDAATAIAGPVTEASGTVIGRYKLLQQIGEGGFGIVYMAEQKEPVKRRVALKIIKLGMDTKQVVARFEAEGQALAMMDHPNIAKVLDGGATESGRPYFVMELVKGVPMTKFCDENNLSTKERLELFTTVCNAIQHAHQKGIIHRDVKPSNILVTLHDGKPVPKVIDFGIAKATQQELTEKTIFTQFQQMIGTPAYMSPEQAEMSGLDIDTRTDIYSLGVLLYELLTGKTPLDAKILLNRGYDEIRRRIKEEEPPRPSTRVSTMEGEELTTHAKHRNLDPKRFAAELRGDLDWIVMKALEKDRTRRYESATGFAQDITRFLANEPVTAVAPSAAYLLKKYARRHRAQLAVAASIAGLLLGGTAVSTWQAIRATQARLMAQAERDKARSAQQVAEEAKEAETQARQQADKEKATAQHGSYVANMNLAQQAWEQNNTGRLKELLDATATSSERGFEWYYWQRQIHLELRTLRGHTGGINELAYSPDGTWLVTASADKTARIWDVTTGKQLHILRGHQDWVTSVAVSRDGRHIATGSSNDSRYGDYSVRVWDAATGEELQKFTGHTNGVSSVAFSPDGQRIASGGADNYGTGDKTVRVWETATGRELVKFTGHKHRVGLIRFSPDGLRILSTSVPDDGSPPIAKVWGASSGLELLTCDVRGYEIVGLDLTPDGLRIVTNSKLDGAATIWDATNGKELLSLNGHSSLVTCAAFSSDGQHIVTGSLDQAVKIWDATTGEEQGTFKGHHTQINSVAFSPGGRQIASSGGDQDKTAKVWDASRYELPLMLRGHVGTITSGAFSPDGRRIVTAGNDTVKVWDALSGKQVGSLEGHRSVVRRVMYRSDGKWIVTGSEDGTVKVWDALSGKEIFTLKGGTKESIDATAISPDGRRIVTGGNRGVVRVWDTASGSELFSFAGRSGRIFSTAFSPDSQRFVTVGDANAAKVWDATTGQHVFDLQGHNRGMYSVAFSGDDRRIITGSFDGTARIWESKSGQEVLTLRGHVSEIFSVAFSPNGQRAVTASTDHTARIWETKTGKELLTLRGDGFRLFTAAFSPDCQRIVTGGDDGTAKVWDAATPQQVADWSRAEEEGEEYVAQQGREEVTARERVRAARAQDVGAIKEWLVLSPIPYEGKDGTVPLNREQIQGEANLQPRAGERVKLGETELAWKTAPRDSDVIDFNSASGISEYDYCVGYAATFIESDVEQTGLLLKVGSDDQSKVYLNGKEIFAKLRFGTYQADADTVSGVTLKKGLNVVVFKVVNLWSDWLGSIHFTDATGQPLKGIQVTLDPKTSAQIDTTKPVGPTHP